MVLKGFCAIVPLLLPKAFQNGGYVFSPIAICFSTAITCYALTCLCQASIKTGQRSYQGLALMARGPILQRFTETAIVLAQLSFCMSYIVFILTNV